MSINVQTANGLQQIGGSQITKEKIISALSYTPANQDDIFSGKYSDLSGAPNLIDDESDTFYIADGSNNIIAMVNSAGVTSVDFYIDNISLKNKIPVWNNKSDFSGNYNDLSDKPNITDDGSESLYITDNSGNVIIKITSDGLFTTDVLIGSDNVSAAVSLLSHIGDDSHIIASERAQWNTNITNLSSHIGNTPIHITADERTAWNNKSDFSGSYPDLANKPTLGSLAEKDTVAKTDLEGSVQTSLGKADTALQSVPAEYVTETELAAKGYLTAVPSEYITETELTAKKYLTAVPSEYVTETELAAKKYLTSYTETDPTVPSWAKAPSKPSYTASEVGAVPTTRKVNNKALSADITLTASDVGALPSTTTIPTVVDNLTSTSTTNALSAKQGKLLNDAINSITTDLGNLGGGDMLTATYDKDKDGIVDNAATLEGHAASYFATAEHAHSEYALANHTHSNNGVLPTIAIESTDGITFTATISGITELTNGLSFMVVPGRDLACSTPLLNINGLGSIPLKRPLSINGGMYDSVQMYKGMSYLITYYNSCWILTSQTRIVAGDIEGTLAVANGGTGVTTLDELKTKLGIDSSSGSVTSGMIRTLNYSDLGYATTVEQTGSNTARFLIVTLCRTSGGTDEDYPYYSMTIDYELLSTTEKLFYGPTNHAGNVIKLYASLNDSGKFVLSVDSASDCHFYRVVGYN